MGVSRRVTRGTSVSRGISRLLKRFGVRRQAAARRRFGSADHKNARQSTAPPLSAHSKFVARNAGKERLYKMTRRFTPFRELREPLAGLTLRRGALLALILAACPSALPQSQSRVIEWPQVSTFNSKTFTTPDNHYIDRIDEVEIESITVEGQNAIFGAPLTASDEWLKNLSFRVKNISTRKIHQVQITLIMPELGPRHRIQIPYICLECQRKVNPISLDPGASVDLTLPKFDYEWAKGIINENLGLSKITKAQVLVSFVTFADGPTVASDCLRTLESKNRCPYGPR